MRDISGRRERRLVTFLSGNWTRLLRDACRGLLLASVLAGCSALHPLKGVPSNYYPKEFSGNLRSGRKTIDLSLLRQTPPNSYLIDTGDVLGIYIEGVLGKREEVPPVHFPLNSDVPPSLGYPIPVREDGTISLPLAVPLVVRGLTMREVEEAIRKSYTVDREILQPGQDRILVSLQRPRMYNILVIRQESAGGSEIQITPGMGGTVNLGSSKRGSGKLVALPAYKNDVLHALAQTGGLPGLDAENTIYVLRHRKHLPGTTITVPSAAPPVPTAENEDPNTPVHQMAGIGMPWGHSVRTAQAEVPYGPGVNGPGGWNGTPYGAPPMVPGVGAGPMGPPSAGMNSPYGTPPLGQPQMSAPPTGPGYAGPGYSTNPYGAPAPYGAPLAGGPAGPGYAPGYAPNGAGAPPVYGPPPVPPVWPQGLEPADVPSSATLDQLREMYGRDTQITRIPIRLHPGEVPDFSEQDIILQDGDIVFIEARDTEIFYTGGLLGGGQYMLPRDYDLDVLSAIAIASGRMGGANNSNGSGFGSRLGGVSALNQDISVSASDAVILRQLKNGDQIPIKVDLRKAMRDPKYRVRIHPGDYIVLQYKPMEAVGAFIERNLLAGSLIGLATTQRTGN